MSGCFPLWDEAADLLRGFPGGGNIPLSDSHFSKREKWRTRHSVPLTLMCRQRGAARDDIVTPIYWLRLFVGLRPGYRPKNGREPGAPSPFVIALEFDTVLLEQIEILVLYIEISLRESLDEVLVDCFFLLRGPSIVVGG
jgi:hypothetical protein